MITYGTSLATIKSEVEQTEVVSLIAEKKKSEDPWFGLYTNDQSISFWIEDGSFAQTEVDATWHIQGSNLWDADECGVIDENGEWDLKACTHSRDYICNRYAPTLAPSSIPTLHPITTQT